MNITHVITTIERGGAEKAVLSLAIAQAKYGHRVRVIPLKGITELADNFLVNNIEVELGTLNQNPLTQIKFLKKKLRASEIVHAHLPRAELISRIAFGKNPLVITRHNSEKFFPKVPHFMSSLFSRWVTQNASVIAISQSVLDFLRLNRELHTECNATVIYYGYEAKRELEVKSKPPDYRNGIKLGTISRLTAQKNLSLFIQFVSDQVANGREVSAHIVGAGPMKIDLQNLVHNLGLSDRIYFLGKLDEVFPFLEDLDFFLLTSNYEGFGLALLEAFDCNVPVIASNVTSIPEVLGANHPGLFTRGSIDSLTLVFDKLFNSKKLRKETLIMQKNRLLFFSMGKYLTSHNSLYLSHRNRA